MRRLVAACAMGAGAYGLASTFGACSGEDRKADVAKDAAPDEGAADTKVETSGDSGDAYPLPPWDPIWHKTTPGKLEIVPPGPALQVPCGERCKVIANSTAPEGIASRRPRASDDWAVFQILPPSQIHAVNLHTGVEYVVDDGKDWPGSWGTGVASVSSSRVFYGIATPEWNIMAVRDLVTGERKEVWVAPNVNPGDGTATTAFAEPYLYWQHGHPDRFYRFDLRNGELKSVGGGGSLVLEGSATGFATSASEGWIDLIDFDKGTRTPLGQKGSPESLGGISSDGKVVAWIDMRHAGPGGELSTYLKPVAGSEVYLLDVAKGVETRLTFDLPGKAVLKTMARAAGETVVWHSWADSPTPAPPSDYAFTNPAPVWFQRAGSKPARLRDGFDLFLYAQPTASGVVTTWVHELESGPADVHVVHVAWPPSDEGGVSDAQADAPADP